ncbi:MAG: fasciclin domain-containing protein [Flavobacteriales bacterium]|nr:fasciclin domain-containing protein [Flavobacteriales bacterium]
MKKQLILVTLAIAVTSCSYAQCGSKSSHHAKQTSYSWNSHSSDIVDVAASADDFTTLVAAVKAADLAGTLKSEGPFTVFAPLNSAFAKLPAGTVKTLLQPENKSKLSAILTYHVVSGEFNARDIIAAINSSGGEFTVKTVNGGELVASLVNGNVILTDANGGVSAVTKTDVEASNGVIHVIDTVVLPG